MSTPNPRGSLFVCLFREWEQLRLDDRVAALVAGWGRKRPELAGADGVDWFWQIRADPDSIDTAFIALLEIARAGSRRSGWFDGGLHHSDASLAARTLLQLMMPKTIGLSRSIRHVHDPIERETIAVEGMWEAIVTTRPEQCSRRIPARLGLRALTVMRTRLAADQIVRDGREIPVASPLELGDSGASRPKDAASETAAVELARVLVWSVRTGVLTLGEARLVEQGLEHGGLGALAKELGVTPEAVWQRHHRVIVKLRTAARGAYDPAA